MGKLDGKVALVTGASKGIGAGIAKALAAEGAKVVVNFASSREGAEQVVAAISQAGGSAVAVGGSVAKASDVTALYAEARRHFNRVDILVNNAGVYQAAPIEAVTEAEFHRHFDTNVLGLLLTTQAAAAQFGPEGGSIINISSLASRVTPPHFAIYNGTKGAVDAITRTLAKELGPRRIRVNAINPGVVATEGTHASGIIGSEFERLAISQTPLGRIAQADDIAPVVLFLASDDSRWITGEILYVAGGM
jgi:3-oxoacyl-[acyl-carrier protein] reductase